MGSSVVAGCSAPYLARVVRPPLKSIRMGSCRTVTEDGTDFRWKVCL